MILPDIFSAPNEFIVSSLSISRLGYRYLEGILGIEILRNPEIPPFGDWRPVIEVFFLRLGNLELLLLKIETFVLYAPGPGVSFIYVNDDSLAP
jgi:hypothetical protein